MTGNLEKAQQTCESWARIYPREAGPHSFRAGIIYDVYGRYEEALEESRKTIALDSDFAIGYSILAVNFAYLERLKEAENALQQASKRGLEIPDYVVERYDLAFLKGNQDEMDRQSALGKKDTGAEAWVSNHEAFVLAYSGHLREAQRMSQSAAELAQQAGQKERAALYLTGAALREAFFGNASAARQSAMSALDLSKNREVEYGVAFALALCGDSSRAQAMANDLERRFPEDTSIRFSYLPALGGRLILSQGQPSKAGELLQIAVPYEREAPPSSFQGFFGAMYPVYVRGEAYLAAHEGTEAATEFRKILNHRGIVVSDPIGALAHLQLGRAFALSGDEAKAKAAYQDFLTLWKDADPDIPILKQAQAEYAKLN